MKGYRFTRFSHIRLRTTSTLLLVAFFIFAAVMPAASHALGRIEGTITVSGDVDWSEMKPGRSNDPDYDKKAARRKKRGKSEPEETNVVVYIAGKLEGAGPQPGAPPPEMAQVRKTLLPHVLPIQLGTTVDFPNRDRFFHNVFSPSRTKRFDLGRYGSGNTKQVTFDKPGLVKVYCNIHSHMRGMILVLDNPCFTKPAPGGAYAIENVPAGTHELVVWHEKFQTIIQTVTVRDGETTRADFTLQ